MSRHSHKDTDAESNSLIDLLNNNKYADLLYADDKRREVIIENMSDFRKFVKNYERKLIELKKHKMPTSHKNFIPLELNKNICKEFRNKEDQHKAQQLQEIILIYLNFKQKEKFTKIKQLRKTQNALPITSFKHKLKEALMDTRVLIIAGDTGCGKSTQVPQFLYEYGYRSIACTQPRRLACIALSKRVSYEMLASYSSQVGFQIRFEKTRTSNTNIVFITEGLLLRQLAVETNLTQYDVIILDEIHERNLFGDFLLGVTKCLIRMNPNIKLILMSATINAHLFEKYFENEGAKFIAVPGRVFPIKLKYLPTDTCDFKTSQKKLSTQFDPAPYVKVLNMIDNKYSIHERGDVLIFVSGVNEICSICDYIQQSKEENSHWIVLPLHSGLALAEQDKVFSYAPDGIRKIIVSTNIAETSLTIDGIRFVIDSGKVREMSYDATCRGQRLKEFWVSKSSAEQRKGRAGRTGPGVCYRLYTEKQFDSFEDYPKPEIFRVPLDTILLQMVAMGLHNVRLFPFIEAPETESIEKAVISLKMHNAITDVETITTLGEFLSNLPVEITIGKMLLMGSIFSDIEKIYTLAAIVSVQNPFTQRTLMNDKCEHEREKLQTSQGDIFIFLRAYCEWLQLKVKQLNTRIWCKDINIEEQRFYEITKLRDQFQRILKDTGMQNEEPVAKLSFSERSRRAGEMRILKNYKRQHKFQEPAKRKVLKLDESKEAELENSGTNYDIRDVDFRLRHDSTQFENLLNSAKLEKRDVTIAKIVLCSGFYPQLAIPDEFNNQKEDSQQFFHTQLKSFISMHPNSYFAKYCGLLKLREMDLAIKPIYYSSKQNFSAKHQILCYQNLLETAKPYLLNCIRMPAAQTLLLFSHTISTNVLVSRVVCDEWLCLDFPLAETGFELLCQAIKIRKLWHELLEDMLKDKVKTKNNLVEKLIDYMSSDVNYGIKRLLPADQKVLYTKSTLNLPTEFNINPFNEQIQITPNVEKGGLNVAENIVYGCLQEVPWTLAMETALSEITWSCKNCEFNTLSNNVEKFIHKNVCQKIEETKINIT